MSQVNYNLFLNIYMHAAIVASILNDEKNIHQLKYRYNFHDYTSLLSLSAFALVSKESVCSYKMRGNLI